MIRGVSPRGIGIRGAFALLLLLLVAIAIGVAARPARAASPATAASPRVVPVHGLIVARLADGSVIFRNDVVPGALPTQEIERYAIEGGGALRPGDQIDAYLDRAPSAHRGPRGVAGRLFDAKRASVFVAGAPNALVVRPLDVGDALPPFTFEDQAGRLVRFADFRGKVVLLSFVFSRCPDQTICPAISAKYRYLQRHLDPRRFHLVELTLDPRFDSPPTLARYGASFEADPARWSLLTGEPAEVKDTLDLFSVSSIQDRPDDFIHDDKLVLVGRDGRIKSIIRTAGWNPDDVIAEAQSDAGLASNPLRRFELAAVAGVIAFCGGSVSTGLVILDSSVFLLGVVLLSWLLVWFGRRIVRNE